MQVELGDLCWRVAPSPAVNGVETPHSALLRGIWDGEMYRERTSTSRALCRRAQEYWRCTYTRKLLYSRSGAVSAYPLRTRVVNVNTKDVRWKTLAYIPQVEAAFLETRKGQEVRSELLQRILHILFRRSVLASHRGAWLN